MNQPAQDIYDFIVTTIYRERGRPGVQHADDPRLMRGVVQQALMKFGDLRAATAGEEIATNVSITPEEAKIITDFLLDEARDYTKRFGPYVSSASYEKALADMKSMIDRHVKKPSLVPRDRSY